MNRFVYNDTEFGLQAVGSAWDVTRTLLDGATALVATGLFDGMSADLALPRARALVEVICPVGVRIVGPDVSHPTRVGDLRFVGPDVAHANFIHWDRDTSSFPKQP
jgi:hypothetical protein